jgi:hypothetical protein
LLLAVPLIFEIRPHVPQFGWVPFGILLGAVVVALGMYAARLGLTATGTRSVALIGVSLTAIVGGLLGLTVTPTQHARLPGTIIDAFPAYATTLGGNDAVDIDLYSITTQLPAFVGPPNYPGEQLVTWWSDDEIGLLREPIGMFHAFFNSIPSDLGILITPGRQYIQQTKPAQVLLMSFNGTQFAESLSQLSQFQPEVVRAGVLRSGTLGLHLWLIDLKAYYR